MTRKALLISILLPSLVILLSSCGNNSANPSLNTPNSSGMSSVSLSMGDTPPTGVTILSFNLTVASAMLEPNDVSLVTTPVRVDMEQLQTNKTFLHTENVPAGTYTSISVTFSNAAMTIMNNSGAAIGSCANGAVCSLTPTLSSTTVSYNGAPFPLTLTADSPEGLLMDFNVNNSIQSDLSIQPAISFTTLPSFQEGQNNGEGESGQSMLELDDVNGQVTAVDTTNNTFTLQTNSGQSLTITVNSNTQYEAFGDSGLANAFASVAVGQTIQTDLLLMTGNVLVAKNVELVGPPNEGSIEGTITAIQSSTQFTMVVFNEEGDMGFGSDIPTQMGNTVTVTLQSGATFNIDLDEITSLPSGLSFASGADLLVGQSVRVQPITGSSGSSITASQVTLHMSQITGQVGTINSADFTLTNLPGLFGSATPAITQIDVLVLSNTQFYGVSGLTALSANNLVSVRGLLFNTSTGAQLAAATVVMPVPELE